MGTSSSNRDSSRDKHTDRGKGLSRDLSFPYLPLDNYSIASEMVNLIPYDVAKKYCVMPIDKIGNIVSLVMENPLDKDAVNMVMDITVCIVRKFRSSRNEILKAIEYYYKGVSPEGGDAGIGLEELPDLKKGEEKVKAEDIELPPTPETSEKEAAKLRETFRFKCYMDAYFPEERAYRKSETVNISYKGVSFKSNIAMPIGTYLSIRIDFPKKVRIQPIVVLVQVIRRTKTDAGDFVIGGMVLEITGEEIHEIIKYASSNLAVAAEYRGLEKRKSKRYNCSIDLWFPEGGFYKKTEIENVSSCGLLFKSKMSIPIGAYLPLQVDLPKDVSEHPLVLLGQVARVVPLKKGYFHIGVSLVRMSREDMDELVKYASMHQGR